MLAREKLSRVGAILHQCSINLSVFFSILSIAKRSSWQGIAVVWNGNFFKVSENCIFNLLTTRNSFLWPLNLTSYGQNVMSYSILVILLFTLNLIDPFFTTYFLIFYCILFNFNSWTFSSVLQLIRGRGQLCKYFPPTYHFKCLTRLIGLFYKFTFCLFSAFL